MKIFAKRIFIALTITALAGCADLTPTEQRVLSGGSIGSAIGIGVTIMTGGCIPCGGSIGSMLGSGLGFAYDQLQYKKPPEKPASQRS